MGIRIVCGKCGLEQSVEFFYKRLSKPSGYRLPCKSCCAKQSLDWINRNRSHCRKQERRRYNDNLEVSRKKLRDKCHKQYWKNPELSRERDRALKKKWRLDNPGKSADRARRTREKNPQKYRELSRIYQQKRRLRAGVRILDSIRSRINMALKSNLKNGRTIHLLGCSIEDFKIYLESKFEIGMSWENYGRKGWHIDHIMPCSIFDLERPEHQKRCFHFSNMQPMWASENIRKGTKVITNQFNLL